MFILPQPCGDCRNILRNFKTPIDWNRFDVAGDARRRAPRDRKKLKTTEGLSGSSTPNLQDGKTTSKDLDQSGASLLDGTQATRSAGRGAPQPGQVSLDQLAMFSGPAQHDLAQSRFSRSTANTDAAWEQQATGGDGISGRLWTGDAMIAIVKTVLSQMNQVAAGPTGAGAAGTTLEENGQAPSDAALDERQVHELIRQAAMREAIRSQQQQHGRSSYPAPKQSLVTPARQQLMHPQQRQ
eukprot:COSAG06_NODE_20015_length_813_cov_0.768908_2_plen_239_part_01